MSDSTTASNILAALAGVCMATWAVLKTYWNVRQIGRDRARRQAAEARARS